MLLLHSTLQHRPITLISRPRAQTRLHVKNSEIERLPRLITTGIAISMTALSLVGYTQSAYGVEVDRVLLERLLTREIESRVHQASDSELEKLLEQMLNSEEKDTSAKAMFPFLKILSAPALSETTTTQDMTNKTETMVDENMWNKEELMNDKEDISEPEVQFEVQDDIKSFGRAADMNKERNWKEVQNLVSQSNLLVRKFKDSLFNVDFGRLKKASLYAFVGGAIMSLFLLALKFVFNYRQFNFNTDSLPEEEQSMESSSWEFRKKQELPDQQTSEDVPLPEQSADEVKSERDVSATEDMSDSRNGLLWRRTEDTNPSPLPDQTFEVEWKENKTENKLQSDTESERQDSSRETSNEMDSKASLSKDDDSKERQDTLTKESLDKNNNSAPLLISSEMLQSGWKTSDILSNVDSSHPISLVPNILRLMRKS